MARTVNRILTSIFRGRARLGLWLVAGAGTAALTGLWRRQPPDGCHALGPTDGGLRPREAASEIQTCLAVIRGHCELARPHTDSPEMLARRMDVAIEAVDEAAALVRRLNSGHPPASQPAESPGS